MQDQQDCWRALREELRAAGIAVVDPSELTITDLDALAERFMSDILPILTPLAIDPAHPFPFIANRGMGLALQLHDAERNRDLDVVVLLPTQIDRFIRSPVRTPLHPAGAGCAAVHRPAVSQAVHAGRLWLVPRSARQRDGDRRGSRISCGPSRAR